MTPKGPLLESNAIARFVASHAPAKSLLGGSFFEQAQVDSWCQWCSNEIEVPMCMVVYPIFGFLPPVRFSQSKMHQTHTHIPTHSTHSTQNPKSMGKGKKDLQNSLKVLENHLRSRSFVVGNSVTLADIVLVSALTYPMKMIFDAKQRKSFPSVTRWFMTMCSFPAVYDALGNVDLCKKEQKPAKAAKKPKKEKKAKGAKQEKKKEKKAAKPKKVRKPKHPLDALEKSSMHLDTWKKTYSNSKPDYYACMKWLKENFDPKGYSIMKCSYKYQDENTVDWLTSNKIHCYIQRLDDVRKYAFGVMAVLDRKATKGYYEVVGAWIGRGTEGPKYILAANEESNTFNWEVLDWDKMSDADYKYISDLWCGSKLADGTEIYDQAVFK